MAGLIDVQVSFSAQNLASSARGSGHLQAVHSRQDFCRKALKDSILRMQFIVISALGSDRTGLVYDLTRVVLDCSGNIVDSRMSAFGNEFAMLLLVSGNWHTLAKLETELKKLS